MTHIVCPVGWGAGVEASHRDRRTNARVDEGLMIPMLFVPFASLHWRQKKTERERERCEISVSSFLSNLQRSLFKSFLGVQWEQRATMQCVCSQSGPARAQVQAGCGVGFSLSRLRHGGGPNMGPRNWVCPKLGYKASDLSSFSQFSPWSWINHESMKFLVKIEFLQKRAWDLTGPGSGDRPLWGWADSGSFCMDLPSPANLYIFMVHYPSDFLDPNDKLGIEKYGIWTWWGLQTAWW
jgi:hypothetical protein